MRRGPARLLAAALALAAGCRAPEGGSAPVPGGPSAREAAPAADTGRPPATLPLESGDASRWQSAVVTFADTLLDSDVAWLRAEGFRVESTNPRTRSALVRVPPGYSRDPMAVNRRIVRVDVQMRVTPPRTPPPARTPP